MRAKKDDRRADHNVHDLFARTGQPDHFYVVTLGTKSAVRPNWVTSYLVD